MKAKYYENDVVVENDTVEDLEVAEEWFIDSYKYHSGELPNEDEVMCFLRGKDNVLVRDGSLIMEWRFEK